MCVCMCVYVCVCVCTPAISKISSSVISSVPFSLVPLCRKVMACEERWRKEGGCELRYQHQHTILSNLSQITF